MADYRVAENHATKLIFNLDDVLEFQLSHSVQIVREGDYQYMCYIDGKCYGTGLTPMYTLVYGIKKFKDNDPAYVICSNNSDLA